MADEENDERGRAERVRNDNDDRGSDEDSRSKERKEPAREAPNRFQEERARRAQAAGARQAPSDDKRPAEPARSQNAAPRAALRENMVENAVKFLTHPSVSGSSSDKKVIFLRDHKGLTKDEIIEAYNRASLPIPAFPPVASGSSQQSAPNTYRAPQKDEYDAPTPSRPPLGPPPGYGYPQGPYPMYPPGPYGPYPIPPPPQAAVVPPPPAGYGLKALLLTGAASAGLMLGATYVTKNYIVPRLSPVTVEPKARELPEPPAVEEVIKQRSARMKEELLQEMQKTAKEQSTTTNDAIASLKTLLQQTLEKKDTDVADLKAELSTLKTRLRDMQMTSSYKPPAAASNPSSSPVSSLPAWQREPQKPGGVNRWNITELPTVSAASAALNYGLSSSSPIAQSPAGAGSVPQTVAAGGTTPIATSPVQPSSPTGTPPAAAPAPAATAVPPAAAAPAAADTPSKRAGEKPYSFQKVMDMVARGEVPPDVRQDIDDKPAAAAGSFAPKGDREVPPKPWAAAANGSADWTSVRDAPPIPDTKNPSASE